MDYETYCEKYQHEIREAYEEELLEHWYPRHLVREIHDGYEEFCERCRKESDEYEPNTN